MRLFTYKPITFLLSPSVRNSSLSNEKDGFEVIRINNKNLSLKKDGVVSVRERQERMGLFQSEKKSKNNLQYILVGRDKSVVIEHIMFAPTANIMQSCCD